MIIIIIIIIEIIIILLLHGSVLLEIILSPNKKRLISGTEPKVWIRDSCFYISMQAGSENPFSC